MAKKVLIVGAGVIGGYLCHVLCEAGNDVTLVARGTWGQRIGRYGLHIRHYVQRKDTVDYPHVVGELPTDERFDAAFVVMRQDQMVALAPRLGTLQTPVVVCVGNNLLVPEVEAAIMASSVRPKTVLFGFQGTAGNREDDRLICVRAGSSRLTLGPATGEAGQAERDLMAEVFAGSYQPNWQRDMRWWLVCHAIAVLPICYVAYRLDCDLTRASRADITDMIEATREGYAAVLAAGGEVLPEGEGAFMEPGPKRTLWHAALWSMAKTPLGRLCATDHCRHAVPEMAQLSDGIVELLASIPGVEHPAWDRLLLSCPSWDELSQQYART